MTARRYPREVIRGDAIRAGIGLILSATPLVVAGDEPLIAIAFGAMFVVFVLFAFRVWRRAKTSFSFDDEGISTFGPGGANLRWTDVAEIKLNYYSTRRDRSGGWMQLVLKGGAGRVAIDSTLEGFDEVAHLSARAASRNNVALSEATVANFGVLGVDLSEGLEP